MPVSEADEGMVQGVPSAMEPPVISVTTLMAAVVEISL
jgi:hypothetical protein